MYDGPHEAAHRQLESAKPVLNSELLQQPLILCPTEQEVEQVGTVLPLLCISHSLVRDVDGYSAS